MFDKKMKKVLFKNLDDIYKSCKKVSRKYGIKYVSIVYLEKVIDLVFSNKISKSEKEAYAIQQSFFEVLKQIVKTCKARAKEIGSDGVSFDFLKGIISIVKENYNIGARKAA